MSETKHWAKRRTVWWAASQVGLSTLATALTPGVDCAPIWIKLLTAVAAFCGAMVVGLAIGDTRRAAEGTKS